ncbi:MAG: RluA family pseudouridine synthase [Bdellovibrionota bacterium]
MSISVNVTHELSADQYLVTHSVGPNQHGVRLDSFLKDRYKKRSREQIQRAIADGAITVKRTAGPHMTVGKLKPSSQLVPGDEVLVLTERKPEPEVNFNYKIIFEDRTLFVIEKPANLPVHPAGRYFFNTLLVHLKTEGHRNPLHLEREYFLVHRIDKETSGILVLTKDKDVCTHLTRQFADRKTEKRYLAIVKGRPQDEFTIDLAMRRAVNSIIELKMETVAADQEGAQSALTRFRRLETHENRHGVFSLVECFPKTGRQHQIRVHLEAAGHPIVGDKLYGMPVSEALRFYERQHLTPEAQARIILPRHALHAAGLRFEHPLTGQQLEFRSELPDDLRQFLTSGRPEAGLSPGQPDSRPSHWPLSPA